MKNFFFYSRKLFSKKILKIGQKETFEKTFTENDVIEFAKLSGGIFKNKIVHGILVGSLISTIAGTKLPGSIYLSQNFKFEKPVYIGEKIIATVELKNARKDKGIFTFITTCKKENDEVVISGEAIVYNKNCTLE